MGLDTSLGYTEGSGKQVATLRDASNFDHQKALAEFEGADGEPAKVSAATPMPVTGAQELMEAIEAMRFAVQSLTRSIGFALPSPQGWPIVEVRQPTAGNLNVTLGSTTIASGTVTTVSTLSNQTNQGGLATNDYIPTLMRMGADNLRRNISVT